MSIVLRITIEIIIKCFKIFLLFTNSDQESDPQRLSRAPTIKLVILLESESQITCPVMQLGSAQ